MSLSTTTTKPIQPVNTTKAWQTIGYYAAFVALGLVAASLGPTLSGLARNTRSELSQISYLFTARSLGYLLGAVQGGRLYDRTPGQPLMATALIMIALVMSLIPVIPLLWLLVAVLLFLGLMEGVLDVGGNTLLVWVHRDRVGPYMNALHFFFGAGAFLSPIIIAQLVLRSGDITWPYWALALLMAPVVFWLFRLPSPPPLVNSQDDPAMRVNKSLLALIVLFFILYGGAEFGFAGWIFSYAVAAGLGSKTVAAYLTSAFWGSLTLGRLIGIPIAARFPPPTILLGDLAGSLVSVGLILLFPGSTTALWLGSLGMGLSFASIFPVAICLAERRMTITGRVTSWFFVGGSTGGMTVPWLIGQLFEPIGPRVAIFIIAADLVIALGLLIALLLYSAQTPTASSQPAS